MPISINGGGPKINDYGPGSSSAIQKNFQKLSSGRRINQAADDAAGLAISESLIAIVASLGANDRNIGNAVSITSVKDGALASIGDITQRMRELAVQAADGSVSQTDRGYLDTEFQQLKAEVDRISQSTDFNGTKLLSGSEKNVAIQVGPNTTTADTLNVKVGGVDATTLGLSSLSLAGTNGANASAAINSLDTALKNVSEKRAENGATQNRLVGAQTSTLDRRTRLQESNSRIRDLDFAEETASLARNQVLQSARVAVSAQANQSASLALNLLNGRRF
jgi:flagellin